LQKAPQNFVDENTQKHGLRGVKKGKKKKGAGGKKQGKEQKRKKRKKGREVLVKSQEPDGGRTPRKGIRRKNQITQKRGKPHPKINRDAKGDIGKSRKAGGGEGGENKEEKALEGPQSEARGGRKGKKLP